MPTKEELIKSAILAYPGYDLIAMDLEKVNLNELYNQARNKEFGDTLLCFIIIELFEGIDEDDSIQERAVQLIGTAVNDLKSVQSGILSMNKQ